MALFKIESQNIANDAIAVAQIDDTAYASLTSSSNTAYALAVSVSDVANNIPRVSAVAIANSSYTILDDTAANTGGGYVVISGSGFASGCQVIIGDTLATSVSFVSSGTLHCQVPAKSAATYNIFIVNPNGATAIGVNALTYSASPTWTTGTPLTSQTNAVAFSLTLSATNATNYAVANGSSLPSGTSLASNGYFYGTVSGLSTATTYNFDIIATDAENQDSTKSFSITFNIDSLWIREFSNASNNNYASQLKADANSNIYVAIDSRAFGGGAGSSNNTILVKYNSMGTKQFEVYDNNDSGEEICGNNIDVYNDVIYYSTTTGANTGSYSQDRNTKVWAMHAGNGATFWSTTEAFSHPTYGSLDDEAYVVFASGEYVSYFYGVNSRQLYGGTTDRPRAIIGSRFHSSNGALGHTYTGMYSNDYAAASGHQYVYDIISDDRANTAYYCGTSNIGGTVFGWVTRIKPEFAKDNNSNMWYDNSDWGFSNSATGLTMRKMAITSTHLFSVADDAAANVNVYKFQKSSFAITWHKILFHFSAALIVSGICTDGEGGGDTYIQLTKSDYSATYIVKLDSSGSIVWQRKFRHSSGTAMIPKGLSNNNNNLYALYLVNSSPIKTLLFKFLKDGTGTSTYGSYIYETTSEINVTSGSHTSAGIKHYTYSGSGGYQLGASGVVNTSRTNSTLTITDVV